MGTIIPRTRKNGSVGYTAQILLKRDGKIVHREAKTFDRKQAAAAWLERREKELAAPGAIERHKLDKPTLSDAIDQYIKESNLELGRTKTQVLKAIKTDALAAMRCSEIRSEDIVAYARRLVGSRQPQTVSNYLSHLGAVFAIARPAWGFALDPEAMQDAFKVTRRLGMTTKSTQRDRRPTRDELDSLLCHFEDREARAPRMMPMRKIIVFALFSTRRQEEITRLLWSDLEANHGRILVRDMKNPGEKIGNHVWVDLPPEAIRVIKSMPREAPEIFPFNPQSISANFMRAVALLGIDDLHFHDLRHEGVSRLFEMGNNIPHVAAVSGHRSWTSLKRYTHLREMGDRYKDWRWLDEVCGDEPTKAAPN